MSCESGFAHGQANGGQQAWFLVEGRGRSLRFEQLWECLTLAGWSLRCAPPSSPDVDELASVTVVVACPPWAERWPSLLGALAARHLSVMVAVEVGWAGLLPPGENPAGVAYLLSSPWQLDGWNPSLPAALVPPALTSECQRLALEAVVGRAGRTEREPPLRLAWIGGPEAVPGLEAVAEGCAAVVAAQPDLELHLIGPVSPPAALAACSEMVRCWPFDLVGAGLAGAGVPSEAQGLADPGAPGAGEFGAGERHPGHMVRGQGPDWRLLFERLADCDLLLVPPDEAGPQLAPLGDWAVLLAAAVAVPSLVIGGPREPSPGQPGSGQGGTARALVEDGVTGCFAAEADWPSVAEALLRRRDATRRLGWAARHRAIGRYATAAQRHLVAQTVAALCGPRTAGVPQPARRLVFCPAGPTVGEREVCRAAAREQKGALGKQPTSGMAERPTGAAAEQPTGGMAESPTGVVAEGPAGAVAGEDAGLGLTGAQTGAGVDPAQLGALRLTVASDDHALEYPMGPEWVAAERALGESDLVAAFGPWLARWLALRYRVATFDVGLPIDGRLFHPMPPDREPVVAYCLPTHRRPLSLDLGVQALQRLQHTCREARMVLFGLAEDEVAREGIRLRHEWAGDLTAQGQADLLRRAAVLLWTEFTNVQPLVAEAMASGCAVVAVDLPHQRWLLVHGETARLVPPRPDLLAEAIVELLRQPDRRQRLVANAYQATAEFAWERVLAELSTLAERCLAERAVAPRGAVELASAQRPLPEPPSTEFQPALGEPPGWPGDAEDRGALPQLDLLQERMEARSPWRFDRQPALAVTFACRHDGLTRVDIAAELAPGTAADGLQLRIGHRLAADGHVQPQRVADRVSWDGRWLSFRFPPLEASGGRRWYAEVTGDDREPDRLAVAGGGAAADSAAVAAGDVDSHSAAVWPWVAAAERLPEARLLVDGQETAYAPTLRTWVTACPTLPITLPPGTAVMLNRLLTLEQEADLVRREVERDRRSLPYRLRHPLADVPRRLPPAAERPWPANAPVTVKARRALHEYGLLALLAEVADWLRWQRMTTAERQRAVEEQLGRLSAP